ncbi:MAG TPA: hypothetical protein VHV55_25590 [Pirellulales bacterium]|jgi:hypothetical protein|nr:hypothetical protein [Pirellulales bacterium]
MDELIGRNYASFDGMRQWELLYEGMLLVILNTGVERGNDHNLVGISADDMRVKWTLGGVLANSGQYDGVVSVRIEAAQVWVHTWSCFARRIDYRTGEVLEEVFTK